MEFFNSIIFWLITGKYTDSFELAGRLLKHVILNLYVKIYDLYIAVRLVEGMILTCGVMQLSSRLFVIGGDGAGVVKYIKTVYHVRGICFVYFAAPFEGFRLKHLSATLKEIEARPTLFFILNKQLALPPIL